MDILFDTAWRLYHGKLSGPFCYGLFLGVLVSSWYICRKFVDPKFGIISKIGAISNWVIILIPILLFLWATYPGVYVIDSMLQLKQTMAQSYGDWHPPLMSWIWGMLITSLKLPEGLFWLHTIFVFFSLLVWSYIILKLTRTPAWVVFLIALLSPVVLLFSGVVIKDTGTAFGFLAACGLAILPRLCSVNKAAAYSFSIIFLFYAASVRQNALPAVLPILFLIFHDLIDGRFKKAKVTSIVCIVAFAFLILGNLIKYEFMKSRREFIQQTLMLHDISFISIMSGHPAAIPLEFQTERFSTTALKDSWIPGTSATLFLAYDNPEHPLQLSQSPSANKELKSNWLNAIISNPGLYLQHKMLVFRSFLQLKGGYWSKDSKYGAQMGENFSLFLPAPLPWSGVVEHILSRAVGFLASWTPLLSVWFWFLALVILSAIGLFRVRFGGMSSFSFGLALSGLLYCAPYFFILPHCEYRYIYWSSIAGVFSFCLLFSKPIALRSR